MVLTAVALAPGLLLLFWLALLCSSWNQSLRRSPRSARSCPVQPSVQVQERKIFVAPIYAVMMAVMLE